MAEGRTDRTFLTRHRWVLLFCLAVLAGALVLSVDAKGRLLVLGIPETALPPLCLWRRLFGVNCPGCGLTRSIVLAAHGHISAAFETHRMGPVFLAVGLLQIPYRLGALFRAKDYPFSRRIDWITLVFLLAALAANWMWNFLV